MAIVHVALKSSSDAPPSAAHADYIMRQGNYGKIGGLVHVESGNMPEFAQARPRQFWEAADAHERANGRTYTELQIALPRELSDQQRITLAREATREFLGSRFAFTMAVHNPEAADKIEQPHLHLMFSERAIDDTTRIFPEERFFKRNGAKKDRKWNDQSQAEEVRAKWCEMMNRALEGAGIDQRVDPRSLVDQGKIAEAILVEPKMLRRGTREEKEARRQEIEEIREAKAVLSKIEIAAPDLASVQKADQASQAKLEASVEQIETWEAEELSKLDRAIEAVKKLARAAAAGVRSVFTRQPAAAAPAPELPPAPDSVALEKVLSWVKTQPDGERLIIRERSADQAIKRIDAWVQEWGSSNHPDAPKMKASWEYARSVLAPLKIREQAERVARLQKQHPHETPERILLHAKGVTLKPPFGKSQERPDRGHSR